LLFLPPENGAGKHLLWIQGQYIYMIIIDIQIKRMIKAGMLNVKYSVEVVPENHVISLIDF